MYRVTGEHPATAEVANSRMVLVVNEDMTRIQIPVDEAQRVDVLHTMNKLVRVNRTGNPIHLWSLLRWRPKLFVLSVTFSVQSPRNVCVAARHVRDESALWSENRELEEVLRRFHDSMQDTGTNHYRSRSQIAASQHDFRSGCLYQGRWSTHTHTHTLCLPTLRATRSATAALV